MPKRDFDTIAIIRARGGSKRIPKKNIQFVGGKPLIAYPIELCKRCKRVGRIIVSTDDDEIMRYAMKYGAETPFTRPKELSEDVPSELVNEHALRYLIEKESFMLPTYCLSLTPATPFVSLSSLQKAFNLIDSHKEWSAVTTVRRASEHPEWILVKSGDTDEFSTLLGNTLDGKNHVSQNLKTFYYPTGGFWINRTKMFLKEISLYGSRWGGVELEPRESLDIDWPCELEKAREMIDSNNRLSN